MAGQRELFHRQPRAKPRKLMHVYDYGSEMAWFKCAHCGYDDGWTEAGKLSDDKRGRPCPKCNPALSHETKED